MLAALAPQPTALPCVSTALQLTAVDSVHTLARPAEVAELIGEDGSDADVLAGADAELRAAVEAVTSQFAFQLDAFQVKAVAHLLDGKSGQWRVHAAACAAPAFITRQETAVLRA